MSPFANFRDASCGLSTFDLTVPDCVRGIAKARDVGLLVFRNGSWEFDCEEYEHYEQVNSMAFRRCLNMLNQFNFRV